MSENKFKEKQKSVNLSYPYSPQSLIWIKNNNNYDDIITFQHAIALFGKSPMFHSLHYGDGIFEGIIALKSNRDDNKINFFYPEDLFRLKQLYLKLAPSDQRSTNLSLSHPFAKTC